MTWGIGQNGKEHQSVIVLLETQVNLILCVLPAVVVDIDIYQFKKLK